MRTLEFDTPALEDQSSYRDKENKQWEERKYKLNVLIVADCAV